MKILSAFIIFLGCMELQAQDVGKDSTLMSSSHVVNYKNLMSEVFDFNVSGLNQASGVITLDGLNSYNHLPGLFCKIEYKIEGKSKLAPRFRLGSLEYTEWMEGKREVYGKY